MAIKPDWTLGTLTLTAGSAAFTTTGSALKSADIQGGDTLITQSGLVLVIATITGENSGTLYMPCPPLAAGVNQPLLVRYQPDGSRLPAATRHLLNELTSGNVAAFAELVGQADMVPIFTGAGMLTLVSTEMVGGGGAGSWNATVVLLSGRDAYDSKDAGFRVMVIDNGTGRSAVYQKISAAAADWSEPIYFTGTVGKQGIAATLKIGTVITGAAGSAAEVINTGTEQDAVLTLKLPAGDTGLTGSANHLRIGTVQVGTEAAAQITGEAPSQVLNLTLPIGPIGPDGKAAAIKIGTVTLAPHGTQPSITNSGNEREAVLDFIIPSGRDGTGSGDMQSRDYDPNRKGVDAFDMANMTEAENSKVMTAEERQDIANAKRDRHVHNNKSVLDNTTESFTTPLKNKLDNLPANANQTNTATVGAALTAATSQQAILESDSVVGLETGTSNVRRWTWGNVKTWIRSFTDLLYATADQGAKADSAVQTVNGVTPTAGNVDISASDVRLADTVASAAATTFKTIDLFVRTSGFGVVGDGGGALYKRVASEPAHAGKFQSVGGLWWGLVETKVSPAMFGVFKSATGDASEGLQNALDYLEFRGGGFLDVPEGRFNLYATLRAPSNVSILSAPNTTYMRMADVDCMLISKSSGSVGGYNAVRNISLFGGTFDCNKDAFPAAATSIAFGHCSDIHLDSVRVLNNSGRYHAVEVNSTTRLRITNCFFDVGGNDEVAGECIQIDGAYNSGVFPWYGPYDDTPCLDVLIENTTITNWATAIGTHSFGATNTRHTDIKIINNSFRTSRNGISMQGWAGVKIMYNRIEGYGSTGLFTQIGIHCAPTRAVGHFAVDILISGNTIRGFNRRNDGDGSAGRGISLIGWQSPTEAPDPTLNGVSIVDNTIQEMGSHAVVVEAGINVTIHGNKIASVAGHGIYIFGTGKYSIKDNNVEVATGKLAITLVSGNSRNSANGIVTGNNTLREIYNNAPTTIVSQNICPALNHGALATGIKGPNLVNGIAAA